MLHRCIGSKSMNWSQSRRVYYSCKLYMRLYDAWLYGCIRLWLYAYQDSVIALVPYVVLPLVVSWKPIAQKCSRKSCLFSVVFSYVMMAHLTYFAWVKPHDPEGCDRAVFCWTEMHTRCTRLHYRISLSDCAWCVHSGCLYRESAFFPVYFLFFAHLAYFACTKTYDAEVCGRAVFCWAQMHTNWTWLYHRISFLSCAFFVHSWCIYRLFKIF